MEIGPEPQELIETVEHNKHHVEHRENADHNFISKCAVTASIMAVLAACGSLLSGNAVNEAIINQTKASDAWAYYQAKSTKEHLVEGDGYIVASILKAEGKLNAAELKDAVSSSQKLSSRYENEKKAIERQAVSQQDRSEHEFAEHEDFSFAVACFQIAIVLASVSMMVHRTWLYRASLGTGIFGLIFIAFGLMT